MISPVRMFQRSSDSYTICMTLPLAGQAAVGENGLYVVGGPHWKPAMNRVSALAPVRPLPTWPLLPIPGRAPAEPLAVPLLDLVEQAARAAPPATTPPSLKSVRRDGVKKTESDIATSVGLARRWALSMTRNQGVLCCLPCKYGAASTSAALPTPRLCQDDVMWPRLGSTVWSLSAEQALR